MAVYPWFAFYPADYIRKVGHLPIATQGLWMWLLCRMDESPRRGVLLYANGEKIEDKSIAELVNDTPGNVRRALIQLEQQGVLSRDPETAAIVSRRMIRDNEKRGQARDKKVKQRGHGGDVPTNVPNDVPSKSRQCPPVEPEPESELDIRTTKPGGTLKTTPNGSSEKSTQVPDPGLVVKALAEHGVGEVVAKHLAHGGVSCLEVNNASASIAEDKTIRRPAAVLVWRLAELHNITIPKGKRVDPMWADFQQTLDRRRA